MRVWPGCHRNRSGVPAGNFFPVGTTTLTYTATDASSNASTASQAVSVVDSTPPSIIGVSVDKPVLWPPNHKLVDVTVLYTSTDNCTAPSCSLSVSVKEIRDKDRDDDNDDDRGKDKGRGKGQDKDKDKEPDWQVLDAHHVRLRAERSGDARERIYTITITCQDGFGNASTKTVKVRVPHVRRDDR